MPKMANLYSGGKKQKYAQNKHIWLVALFEGILSDDHLSKMTTFE